ncbi:SCO family protein [Methylacidimicrobium sp. B4]|uniref:SCO family protein n=1 Tax=Methylacidimicrobium sp. B4 TaxID=2796139 RepID=UPI001A8D837E|nr:SCO family protein [Methylacidimicrobium sp. B4]QSR85592.1 SCO family protein [Methylacidimicrobium sp. B4]
MRRTLLCAAASCSILMATLAMAADSSVMPAGQSHGVQSPVDFDLVPPAPGSYRLERIMPAPDGMVLDIDGKEKRLSQFTTGKITLLSFIYTSCRDAKGCPLAYAVLQRIERELEKRASLQGKVRLVTLSFDPQHDTPEVMRQYGGGRITDSHGLRWHFLTPRSQKAVIPLLDGFGQDLMLVSGPEGKQEVSHVLKVFLMDKAGEIREIYSSAFLVPQVVLNDIETLLLEEAPGPR